MRNMGRIFYLDAANGNDKNNGITPDEALKSLEAANRIVFGEGDKLLLKCGCVDRKSTRLNSSHNNQSRMPSSA